MYFDALSMACIAEDLRNAILGGRVQQVLLPNKLSIGLEVYSQGRRHYLLASAHAELGSLFLAADKLRRGVDRETGLLLLLRKYARGACISAIAQPPFERILRLRFDHPEWGYSILVIEIMGRHSNIMLVSPDGQVLDAVKRVGTHQSSKRPILPGRPYTPPPPQAKLDPSDLTEYRLRQMLAAHEPDTQVWRALVKGLRGVSPLLAREVAFRALGHPRAPVLQVERLTPLLRALRELLSPLDTGLWQPTAVLVGDRPVVYAAYPVTHRGDPQPVPSLSQAIEAYTAAAAGSTDPYAAAGSTDPYAAAKHPVREAIDRARARLQRRRQALQGPLNQAAEADRWRQWGEWVLAYAHTIAPGQRQLVAEVGLSEPLSIPLDPEKSASENAQTYFARYRKAQRATEGGPLRLNEVNLALRDLEQLETDLELASSRPEIDNVRAALVEARYLRAKKRLVKTAPSRPLSLTSPDGLTILVGRNSRQNDQVTFRRAKGDDWWFHARGVPGAHVIVRSGGRELPPDTVHRAAELAAYFSRLRGESRVAVDYTQRRHVRRIPGAAPGLVSYGQERTIRVTPSGPERNPHSENHQLARSLDQEP